MQFSTRIRLRRRLTAAALTLGLALAVGSSGAPPAAAATDPPSNGADDRSTAAQQEQRQNAIEREKAWATRPEIVKAADYAKRGVAPPGALEAAQRARADVTEDNSISATSASMRDNLYYAAKWYYDNQTITYTWSDYWTPCNMYQADCECFNRLVFWDAGWGQLWYTLRGQATTGFYTSYPRYGDLVFFDYDGDGWEGPYDHTGVYTGNGWVLHSSATYGYVLWSKVSVISAETWGGHWYVNIVDA